MPEIVPADAIAPNEWDDFCALSDDAWFWHTSEWRAYNLEYRPDLDGIDLSFLVMDGGRIVGICPLILERLDVDGREVKEFSYAGGACPAPAIAPDLSPGHRDKVLAAITDRIDALAAERGVERVSLRFSPLSGRVLASPPYNPLLRHGFIDVSLLTQLIDLTEPIEALRRAMRKGHAYDVRRGLAEMDVSIFDQDDITRAAFTAYRRMHRLAAGRVTRPRVTFDRMEDWIRRGEAVLLGAYAGRTAVGFSLVMLNGAGAYYASAANDPARRDLPVAHVLQWTTIEWLKERGFSLYEVGWQPTLSTPHYVPTPKELRIASFKRGFGGVTVPLHGGEKYYSRRRLIEVSSQRTESLAEALFPSAEHPADE